MSPFAPRGDRSLRVIVTELAVAASYDEVITFEQLGKALSLDPASDQGRTRIRQAVTAARPTLLRDRRRVLVSDRGVGYRVGRPGEFAGVAEQHRDRGQRQISRALAVIEHAPEADMTSDELRRHRAVGLVVRNLNNRLTDAEQRLDTLETLMHELMYGPPRPVIPGELDKM